MKRGSTAPRSSSSAAAPARTHRMIATGRPSGLSRCDAKSRSATNHVGWETPARPTVAADPGHQRVPENHKVHLPLQTPGWLMGWLIGMSRWSDCGGLRTRTSKQPQSPPATRFSMNSSTFRRQYPMNGDSAAAAAAGGGGGSGGARGSTSRLACNPGRLSVRATGVAVIGTAAEAGAQPGPIAHLQLQPPALVRLGLKRQRPGRLGILQPTAHRLEQHRQLLKRATRDSSCV